MQSQPGEVLVASLYGIYADWKGVPDLEIHGNVVDHEYKIERDGDTIAEVSKRWFRVRDTYGVEIDADVIAVTRALDVPFLTRVLADAGIAFPDGSTEKLAKWPSTTKIWFKDGKPLTTEDRSFRLMGLAWGGAALMAASASAQEYPTHPIRIIVPFATGGPADIYARFIGQRLQESLGQPVIVDNRPGAGAIIGTDAVAKSAPDGYTLLLMSNTHTINETLIPSKPYALLRDFAPIAPINYSDLVLVVNPSVPAKTVPELIAYVKDNPGKVTMTSDPYRFDADVHQIFFGHLDAAEFRFIDPGSVRQAGKEACKRRFVPILQLQVFGTLADIVFRKAAFQERAFHAEFRQCFHARTVIFGIVGIRAVAEGFKTIPAGNSRQFLKNASLAEITAVLRIVLNFIRNAEFRHNVLYAKRLRQVSRFRDFPLRDVGRVYREGEDIFRSQDVFCRRQQKRAVQSSGKSDGDFMMGAQPTFQF